jgi:hypothetical protein
MLRRMLVFFALWRLECFDASSLRGEDVKFVARLSCSDFCVAIFVF